MVSDGITDSGWSVIDPGAVLAWSVVQVGALALGLLQVPLAAKYPPAASLTPDLLIAGQVGGAALLVPLLCRTPATALVALASAWPALLLAGGVGARPVGDLALAGLAVSAWFVTLYFWTSCVRSPNARQAVAAAATLLAFGGALLGYLVIEFASGRDPEIPLPESLRATPLLLAWGFVHGRGYLWGDSIPLALLLIGGLVARSASSIWTRKPSGTAP